ncbi:ABC transporter ATP-binding protein [Alkalibaculum bacchi]|uniref:ABC transporter ATP-binding protein n=1 Tax=Alkalibaculum bacchi TaxID=645887 RepID=UPI0026F3533A|nr:ABC transporter ATP-binding protein [Alkalibaculum bacchi]
MLKVKNLSFHYNKGREILSDVSFELHKNDVSCLLGSNGTGKTTLLRCLLALNKTTKGIIKINGQDISKESPKKRAKYMAYVPQASTMAFPYLAKEVVLMGRIAHLGPGASPNNRDHKVCREVLENLGIYHLAEKVFNQMSGGERQMFLVARAMVQQAQILVMDEPTANLDYSNQVKILQIIKQLSEEGYSILMTSHFPDHAFLSCNKVMLMKGGKIIEIGKPEDAVTTQNLSNLYDTRVCVADVELCQEDITTKVCVPIMKKAK